MKKIFTFMLLLWGLLLWGTVPVDFFYQPGRNECAKVKALVLPPVLERFGAQIELREYDIGALENYEKLVAFQEGRKNSADEPVSIVVDNAALLAGYDEIDVKLVDTIAAALKNESTAAAVEAVDWRNRADSFTFEAVALAGGVYCGACFLSYFTLGFGLFHILKEFSGYLWLRCALEWSMVALLTVLAFLSFRDAIRFRQTGRAEGVTLQLPDSIKVKIHAVMRRGLAYRYLLPGTFAIGVLVTALESVCTGQVYVPTLVLMTQTEGVGREFGLLLLYNVMFILPLLAVFYLAYRGIKLAWFLKTAKQNVVFGKSALGAFFVLMIGMILFL